MMFLEVVRR